MCVHLCVLHLHTCACVFCACVCTHECVSMHILRGVKVDQFLDSLINFDKENISDANLKAVQPYLADKEFDPDFIRSKSAAAAGLCSWTVNIVRFYEVYCDVEPKRNALAAANAELASAQEKLGKIKAKIKVCSLILAV